MAGATSLHTELEAAISQFLGSEAAVLFPTGQAANQGIIQALCNHRDTVVLDKLVHYSILDGVRLSGARWHSFRHSDPEHLAKVLENTRSKRPNAGILVVVEGIYGIDGDVAPLKELLEVCHRYNARMMVDEAHATGVLGATGRGTMEATGISGRMPIIMGSLSKSLGSFGGWIATSSEVADYLRYYARTITFSVGLPPSCAGAAIASLKILQSGSGELARLRENSEFFRQGLLEIGIPNASKSASAIMSVPIGDEKTLRDVSRHLFRNSVCAEALAVPAVPRGQERMRFRVSAAHTKEQLAHVLNVIQEAFGKFHLAGVNKSTNHKANPVASIRVADNVADPVKIAELSSKAAGMRGHPTTWLRHDDYAKILKGQSKPVREASSFRHFVAEGANGLKASVGASLEPQISTAENKNIGALGHIHWLPGEEAVLGELIAQAKKWLTEKGVTTVLAPIQTPLHLLNGGIASQENPANFPMFQPHGATGLKAILQNVGFQPDIVLPYWRVKLPETNTALTPPEIPKLSIRSIDKTHLQREIAIIQPIINQSLGRLKYCGAFDLDSLYELAHELRDLIVGDFWKIAEIDGKPAGFIGAFPDVTQALMDAGGSAGTADLENIGWSIAGAKRASIAWLGVVPEFESQGVGHAMLKALYTELLNRNFSEAWLHWEFVDGDCRSKDFLPPDAAVIDQLDYTVFKWQASDDKKKSDCNVG